MSFIKRLKKEDSLRVTKVKTKDTGVRGILAWLLLMFHVFHVSL